jgi:hypothetical protein
VEYPDGNYLSRIGATGVMLQSDVFQTIGHRLSVRGDTFVIRAYGDVAGLGATARPRAKVVLEAVVQRLPEYMEIYDKDSKLQPPYLTYGETGYKGSPITPKPAAGEAIELSTINRHLGRRFKILSIRELPAADI